MAGDEKIVALETRQVPVSAKTTWIFVRVRTSGGLEGHGEATRPGAEAAIAAELAGLGDLLVGQRLTSAGGLIAKLRSTEMAFARRLAVNACEQALLDAFARHAGVSLAELLGGPCRALVPFYANINRGIADRSPAGFAARAKAVAAQGYTSIKIAPFDGLVWSAASASDGGRLVAAGVERILAVREAIGPAPLLMVDCHWRLTPKTAADVLVATRPAGLYWLEDPLEDAEFEAVDARRVRDAANRIGVRLAGGERVTTLAGMRALLARGAYDVVLPDLRDGGVRQTMAMLELAVASGVEASLHNPMGPVLDAGSLQVAAALASFSILEGQVGESPRFEEIAGGSRALVDGARPLPTGGGTGFSPRLPAD